MLSISNISSNDQDNDLNDTMEDLNNTNNDNKEHVNNDMDFNNLM